MSDTTSLGSGLASTANSAASAPPPSEPVAASPTPASDPKPTSVDAALQAHFAKAEDPPATPDPPAPPVHDGAAPTTEEPQVDASGDGAKKEGPIPLTVHKTALENARVKAAQEAEQRFQQQYGNQLQVVEALRSDLPGTLDQLIEESLADPHYGQHVRAMLARRLSGLRQKAQPAPVEEGEPSLFVEQNGERYFDPSAFAKWQAWQREQLKQELSQEFAPLTKLQTQITQAQQIAQFQKQSQQTVAQRLKFWNAQPGFSEHAKAIAAKQKELFDANAAQGMDEWTALGVAYAQVVPALLQAKSTSQWAQDAAQKARGSSPNPATSAPAQPFKPKPGMTVDQAIEGALAAYRS